MMPCPAWIGLDFQTGLAGGWVLLAALLAVGVLSWLYRRLFVLYGRRRAAVLLVLKSAAAVLLLAGLLRPVLVREERDYSRSRVVLLVDDSRSMATRDGALGAARIEEARAAAFGKLLPRLKQRLPVTVLAFSGATRPLEAGDQLQAAGDGSGIVEALTDGARSAGGPGRVGGFVLVSDGGDAPALPPGFAPGAPVFALAVGSDLAGCDDLGIVRDEHPERADERTEFELRVEVAATGNAAFFERIKGASLALSDGADPVASQPVALTRETPRRALNFRVKSGQAGLHRYTLRLPAFPGEVSALNNQRSFTVEVENPSLRVLYYAPELGQGYKAFRNAVKSDPGIHFTGLVRLDKDRFLLQGEKEGDGFNNSFPAAAESLGRFKCVVLDGCRSADLSPEAQQALARYVSGGGALVILGGPDAFGRGGWEASPLRPLFPWELAASEPPFMNQSVPLELPPLGRAHAIFRGLEEAFAAGGPLERLKGYNLPGAPRPGAQALLNLRLPAGERPAAMALTPYGQGKVLGVASDGTWLWSQAGAEGQRWYCAFWRQALRYLADRESGGTHLKLSTLQTGRYLPGDRATITAHVLDRAFRPFQGTGLTASLKDSSGAVAGQVLFAEAGPPGVYTAQVELRLPGTFLLEATLADAQGPLESRQLVLEAGARDTEGSHLALNRPFLEALASRSGGAVLAQDHADELAERVLSGVQAAVSRKETSLLWDTPAFFLLFLGLMSAEWIARRRMNLI